MFLDGAEDVGEGGAALGEDRVDLEGAGAVEEGAVGDAGEDDDGEGSQAEVGSHDLQEGGAVHLGHEEVEDDQVGDVAEDREEGVAAVRLALDLEAGLLQITHERFGGVGVVFDNKDRGHIAGEGSEGGDARQGRSGAEAWESVEWWVRFAKSVLSRNLHESTRRRMNHRGAEDAEGRGREGDEAKGRRGEAVGSFGNFHKGHEEED